MVQRLRIPMTAPELKRAVGAFGIVIILRVEMRSTIFITVGFTSLQSGRAIHFAA